MTSQDLEQSLAQPARFSASSEEIPFFLNFQNATSKSLLVKINDYPIISLRSGAYYPRISGIAVVIAEIGVTHPTSQEQVFIGRFQYINTPTQYCHPWIGRTPKRGDGNGREYYEFFYYLSSVGTITEFARIDKELWDSLP